MTEAGAGPALGGRLAGGRALVLGTGVHQSSSGLADLASVAATVTDLGRTLVERCGLAENAVDVLLDPPNPTVMGEAVAAAADATPAGSPLLVYYVGHGLVSPRGLLHLATAGTDRRTSRVEFTALAYPTLRRILLDSGARPLVVVLDCCFSGRALDGLAESEQEVVNLAAIDGAFVLTSAGRAELALAPAGAKYTGFSGALLELLEHGDPEGPAELTLQHAFAYLSRVLPAAGLPGPRRQLSGRAEDLLLGPNVAYRERPGTAPAPQTVPPHRPVSSNVCPYKGLATFESADASWFFGRDRPVAALIAEVAARATDPRPLVVTGASGSGKSSLLRAGLIPGIRQGDLEIPGSAGWPQRVFTPTADPLTALASQVAELTGLLSDHVDARLRADPTSLVALLTEGTRGRDSSVILVVDQFEEVFTECPDESARRAFILALSRAAGVGGEPVALVVLGLRADFFGAAAAYPQLGAAMSRPIVVGPMTVLELRQAVQGPAHAVGLTLEPGLVELLVADLGVRADAPEHNGGSAAATYDAGRLPLLSHALLATWHARQNGVLTVDGYIATGGIHGALATTADRVLDGLDEPGKRTAQALLLRLVHISEGVEDSRRRVDRQLLLAELPDPDRASLVLTALAAEDARLVTIDGDAVEVTHEALLRSWPTLRTWIDTDRVGLLLEQQLTEAAQQWNTDGRDPGGLYRGGRLAVASEWAEDSEHRARLGLLAVTFLEASIEQSRAELFAQQRRNRRRTLIVTMLATLLVLSLVAGGLAVQQQRNAALQLRAASARDLVIQSLATRDPRLRLQLVNAADWIERSAYTRQKLINNLTQQQGIQPRIITAQGNNRWPAVSTSVSAAGDLALISYADRDPVLWSTSDLRVPQWDLDTGHAAAIRDVALAGAGRIALTASDDGTAIVWDTTSHSAVNTLNPRIGLLTAVTASADGRTAITGSADGSVTVWDITAIGWDPARPTVRPIGRTSHEDHNGVTTIAISRDGGTVLTGHRDGSTVVGHLTGPDRQYQRVTVLPGSGNEVASVAVDALGRTAITLTDQGKVVIWNITDPASPRRTGWIAGGDKIFTAVALDPTGRLVVIGTRNGAIDFLDVTSPEAPFLIYGRLGDAVANTTVALSADGRVAVTVNAEGIVTAWDLDLAIELVADPRAVACEKLSGVGLSAADWTARVRTVPFEATCGPSAG